MNSDCTVQSEDILINVPLVYEKLIIYSCKNYFYKISNYPHEPEIYNNGSSGLMQESIIDGIVNNLSNLDKNLCNAEIQRVYLKLHISYKEIQVKILQICIEQHLDNLTCH